MACLKLQGMTPRTGLFSVYLLEGYIYFLFGKLEVLIFIIIFLPQPAVEPLLLQRRFGLF